MSYCLVNTCTQWVIVHGYCVVNQVNTVKLTKMVKGITWIYTIGAILLYSLWRNDVVWAEWSLGQITTCHLFVAKSLSKLMLTQSSELLWKRQWNMNKNITFHSRKYIGICRLQKWRPFCSDLKVITCMWIFMICWFGSMNRFRPCNINKLCNLYIVSLHQPIYGHRFSTLNARYIQW